MPEWFLWLKSSLKKTTACSLPASSALAGCFTLWSWCFSPLSLLGCMFSFSRCRSGVLYLSDLGVPLLYLTPPMAVVTLHLFFNLKTFWWRGGGGEVVCVARHVGVLVPWQGIEPESPALEAWSLNHWTPREVPTFCILVIAFVFLYLDSVWNNSLRVWFVL